MFAQWWGLVQVQSAIFVQRLVTWDSEAFQSPTTAQTQTLYASQPRDFLRTIRWRKNSSNREAGWLTVFAK
jgi:hypothetical protein